jgi:hypothetical protein
MMAQIVTASHLADRLLRLALDLLDRVVRRVVGTAVVFSHQFLWCISEQIGHMTGWAQASVR